MTEATPDIAAFIAEYGTPYDPATDTYRRAPFAEPIKAGKNTAIYNAHSYHTKVPPQGIVPYIEHYTAPGDLVLDPFCGSGMTGVAALMCGRHAILNDLSPAAVHIARNYCTPVDVQALQREFERIKAAVADEFDWLYGTTCDRCGGHATIQYTIWSDVLECDRCYGEMVLWDIAVDKNSRKVEQMFPCPHCQKQHRKLGLKKLSPLAVWTSYECSSCTPRRGEHSITVDELQLLDRISSLTIPYRIPDTKFDPIGPQYRRSALSNRKIVRITDLFTKRNLWAYARLWTEVEKSSNEATTGRLKYILTAITGVASRRNRWPQQQTISGTIYIPSISIEMNVGSQFVRRAENVIDALKVLEQVWQNSSVYLTVGSATHLDIPDNTVDFIFTDPPFGSSIYYSELNLIETWS